MTTWEPADRLLLSEDGGRPDPREMGIGAHAGRWLHGGLPAMGHSSIQITRDRYGHLFPATRAKAAAKLDALRDSAGS